MAVRHSEPPPEASTDSMSAPQVPAPAPHHDIPSALRAPLNVEPAGDDEEPAIHTPNSEEAEEDSVARKSTVHEDATHIFNHIMQQSHASKKDHLPPQNNFEPQPEHHVEPPAQQPPPLPTQLPANPSSDRIPLPAQLQTLTLNDDTKTEAYESPRKETNPFRSALPRNPMPAAVSEPSDDLLFESPQPPAVHQQPPQPPQPAAASSSSHSPLPPTNPWADGGLEAVKEPPKIPQPTLQTSSLPPPTTQPQAKSPETPNTRLAHQRNQIYQIRRVRWNNQPTPILTQNANGPCPLLALVNALVLTTPSNLNTALVECLRTREQVSLGLLLDAVFDELTSGRRGDPSQQLPDVGELYAFLLALHTGMNVNPRLVPESPDIASLSSEPIVGGFEQTREMRFYSTFALPLIHGWLPKTEEAAYAAFSRSAPTFDEAQSFLFGEDELESKLKRSSLTPAEQTAFMDLVAIKDFFQIWPTQLTEYGLRAIKACLAPGQVAILFRNDHFSTLYIEPKSGRLLALVTDAGYASHEEIVWESLEDISGRRTEMFSGDFRTVTHDAQGNIGVNDDAGWTTVQGRNSRPQNNQSVAPASTSTRTAENSSAVADGGSEALARQLAEQQDHDLALAMQLQEEEEERQRSEEANRRRGYETANRFPSHEARRPQIPPRRNNNGNDGSPNVVQTETGALPSYEQAAATRPFHPPRNHPSSEYAPRQEGSSQSQSTSQNVPGTTSSSRGRRVSRAGRMVDRIPNNGHWGHTPFDPPNGRATQSSVAVADRREGCAVM